MRLFFKPLLLTVTAFNVFLFVSLFGSRGEGRPMLTAYLSHDASAYQLSDLVLLQRVVTQIDRDYVDPDRIVPNKMLIKAFERIQRDIPELMFAVRDDGQQLVVTVGGESRTFDVAPSQELGDMVDTLKLALRFVERNLETDVAMRDVEYSAINGILNTLDPHSVLLPPDMAREMDVQIQGEFGGLGITISLRGEDNTLTVINTLPDTPASRVGLKAGDQIVQIEDESTINMSLNEAVSKLRGRVGTTVNIHIQRQSWEENRPISIRRETIRIQSIASSYLGDNIGYVHIKTFQHNTSRDLNAALRKLKAEHGELKGLVLDLRKNPGGPLQQAIDVSDKFLESGVIVMTVQADNRDTRSYTASSRGTEPDYPIVVVVDSDSASASEIVAGALKNQNRAVVVGDQTFGKGSVQNLYTHRDQSKLKLTMAQYLTPGRMSIQSVGITPDLRLVPVYFDQKSTFFYSTGHIFREKDLDAHFEESLIPGQDSPPMDVVRYFSPKDFKEYIIGDDEAEVAAKKTQVEEPEKEDPAEDFQVTFAKDLIRSVGRPTRSGTLEAAGPFLNKVKATKDAEIAKQFEALGIDWSTGHSSGVALSAEVTLGVQGRPLKAGEKAPITVKVTNLSKQTAYQVRALTECDVGVFGELEFLFGKIGAGKSKSYTREVKVPKNVFSLVEPMTVKLFESEETPADEISTKVIIDARPEPAFAYSLVSVDDGSGDSVGNGDGLIQRGEDIDLILMVENIGDGPAARAMAKIQNKSGKDVYLTRGTANLKEIGVGQWLQGRFHFKVRDGLGPNVIEFDMISGDVGFTRRPKSEVQLPVQEGPPGTVAPSSGFVRVTASAAAPIFGGASRSTTLFARAKTGSVLKVTGRFNGWTRVNVPFTQGSMSGWIPASHLEKGGPTISGPENITPVFENVPPLIKLTTAERELPNAVDSITLTGDVVDDKGVTLLYGFVNNKKRYLHQVGTDELVKRADGQVATHFRKSIPLEEGTNTIELYARDADMIQSMQVFQIFRAKKPQQQAVLDTPSDGKKVR